MSDLLCYCYQPGGISALSGILWELHQRGVSIALYLSARAASFFKLPLPYTIFDGSPEEAAAHVRASGAKALLTDTSDLVEFEEARCLPRFWETAALVGIPSFGYLDYLWPYERRFSLVPGIVTFPDYLVLCDEVSKKEAIARFKLPEMRCISHNLPMRGLVQWFADTVDSNALEAKATHFFGERTPRIVYLSEPLSERATDLYERGAEFQTLEAVLQGFDTTAFDGVLIIQKHPRDVAEKYLQYVGERVTEVANYSVLINKGLSNYELIVSADLVLGMRTVLLLEGILLGRPALSITAFTSGDDFCPSNRLGVTKPVGSREELAECIRSLGDNRVAREALWKEQYRSALAQPESELLPALLQFLSPAFP